MFFDSSQQQLDQNYVSTNQTVQLVQYRDDVKVLRLGNRCIRVLVRRYYPLAEAPLGGILEPDGVVSLMRHQLYLFGTYQNLTCYKLVPRVVDFNPISDIPWIDIENLLHWAENFLRDGRPGVDVKWAVICWAIEVAVCGCECPSKS